MFSDSATFLLPYEEMRVGQVNGHIHTCVHNRSVFASTHLRASAPSHSFIGGASIPSIKKLHAFAEESSRDAWRTPRCIFNYERTYSTVRATNVPVNPVGYVQGISICTTVDDGV